VAALLLRKLRRLTRRFLALFGAGAAAAWDEETGWDDWDVDSTAPRRAQAAPPSGSGHAKGKRCVRSS
jgi:hypothetical protein